MNLRIFFLLSLGFVFASCGVDPRWGPPRTGLLEPLRWQYEGLNPGPGAAQSLPVAFSASNH